MLKLVGGWSVINGAYPSFLVLNTIGGNFFKTTVSLARRYNPAQELDNPQCLVLHWVALCLTVKLTCVTVCKNIKHCATLSDCIPLLPRHKKVTFL